MSDHKFVLYMKEHTCCIAFTPGAPSAILLVNVTTNKIKEICGRQTLVSIWKRN